MKIFKLLTNRQLEVFKLIALGKCNKEIAWKLGVSIKTVEKHRQSVMNNLGIRTIAGLAHYALHIGLVENMFLEKLPFIESKTYTSSSIASCVQLHDRNQSH